MSTRLIILILRPVPWYLLILHFRDDDHLFEMLNDLFLGGLFPPGLFFGSDDVQQYLVLGGENFLTRRVAWTATFFF